MAQEVSTTPPKNVNEMDDEDSERNEEAGGFTGTSNESPLSPQPSEVLSDDQEEDSESIRIVTTPPLGTSRTELSLPKREKKAPRQALGTTPVAGSPTAINCRTAALKAEMNFFVSEMEKQLYHVEEKVLRELKRDQICHREEQLSQQGLFQSMNVEIDHMARA